MWSLLLTIYIAGIIPISIIAGSVKLFDELHYSVQRRNNLWLAFFGGMGEGAILGFGWPIFLFIFVVLSISYVIFGVIDNINFRKKNEKGT